ncbi:hypothetical protein [Brucella pseudogrignonensis]|uniref:hypothetical protein n=1 Tax=Brucella pseudogrignonensis TaxID=419475 RepID=UPI0038D0440D
MGLPENRSPLVNCLIFDEDIAISQPIFDEAKTQWKAVYNHTASTIIAMDNNSDAKSKSEAEAAHVIVSDVYT